MRRFINSVKRNSLPALIIILTLILTGCDLKTSQTQATSETIQPTIQDRENVQGAEEPQIEVPPSVAEHEISISKSSLEIINPGLTSDDQPTTVIVDTGQGSCYSDTGTIPCPKEGEAFYGQDAQYQGPQPSFVENGNGTVSDLNTGLMWQSDPGEKLTYQQAVDGASSFRLAGYEDWRLPTVKELYSLILFSGTDASVCAQQMTCTATPFIDTAYFAFEYGDSLSGERMIDSQWATSTLYTSEVMGGQRAMFGVNFADGRIKGYPVDPLGDRGAKTFFVIYVRGNPDYGENNFEDNGDGTITDQATGLTWTQADSGTGLDWEGALSYCADLGTAGNNDWRLPNAKELQSIVDYSRSPDANGTAAIDPVFETTPIMDEVGDQDFPAYWSSTTHVPADGSGKSAVYISFGEALGYMHGSWMDVHGAGAQRAELKSGNPAQFPTGRGPQGDAIRIYNYARCVSGG